MEGNERIILVSGATGRQGGAAVRRLLHRGFKVRAMTRRPNPSDPRVKELAEMGARVVQGDLDDPETLREGLEGVYGVFSVQNFWEHGYEGEVRQGKNLAEAARKHGVQHFIQSSVGGAERGTGIPHFESKWEIECCIRELGLPATVLRPVFFMENFSSDDFLKAVFKGRLSLALKPQKPLQMIAVDDVGAFAALCFERPRDFMGEAVEIAGDELTMTQVAESMSRVTGREVRFEEIPIEKLRSVNGEMAAMFEWFNERGYEAHIPSLRALHPGLQRFETWLKRTGWQKPGEMLRRAA